LSAARRVFGQAAFERINPHIGDGRSSFAEMPGFPGMRVSKNLRCRVAGVKRMTRFGFFVLMIATLGVKLVSAAQLPVGKWQTVDEKSGKVTSEVEIYEQSGKLFGKIVALTEPNDKQGKPKVCIACTGADKDKPIVGLVILRNLSLDGDRYKGGTVLDPEDGKVYSAEIWVEEGKLMVRGYSGFLYKTRTWLKA
jgi:uncharacterized protein (DUF2147 family)